MFLRSSDSSSNCHHLKLNVYKIYIKKCIRNDNMYFFSWHNCDALKVSYGKCRSSLHYHYNLTTKKHYSIDQTSPTTLAKGVRTQVRTKVDLSGKEFVITSIYQKLTPYKSLMTYFSTNVLLLFIILDRS